MLLVNSRRTQQSSSAVCHNHKHNLNVDPGPDPDADTNTRTHHYCNLNARDKKWAVPRQRVRTVADARVQSRHADLRKVPSEIQPSHMGPKLPRSAAQYLVHITPHHSAATCPRHDTMTTGITMARTHHTSGPNSGQRIPNAKWIDAQQARGVDQRPRSPGTPPPHHPTTPPPHCLTAPSPHHPTTPPPHHPTTLPPHHPTTPPPYHPITQAMPASWARGGGGGGLTIARGRGQRGQ